MAVPEPSRQSPAAAACIAATRFGFGEADTHAIGADAQGWVLAQFQRATPLAADGLLDTAAAGALSRRALMPAVPADAEAATQARRALREATLQAFQQRWQQVVSTAAPVFERWVWFWSNHFCVSAARAQVAGLVMPFEREAIRPHVLGRFVDLLRAATVHPAMLLYLDNAQSIGPASRAGMRRSRGLNENLGRELLELHTLGVDGGYTQADVLGAAQVLTGWSLTPRDEPLAMRFNPALHEPGAKQVLSQRVPAGPQGLDALLQLLAQHPATARHVATQLVRHFVADDPPPALVQAVAARWQATDGDLTAIAQALFSHPVAWALPARKVKRPDELLLSAHRTLGAALPPPERTAQLLVEMGQPIGRAPSPQGWPDRAADWLGPDALFKRVAWAQRLAQAEAGRDERRLGAPAERSATDRADRSLGPLLTDTTRREIERAASPAQGLALWLASPEFQRR